MSLPRRVLRGTTYLITRRCFERRFLLRPNRLTNLIFRYCLAVAAHRYGIQVHAYCVLSNHYHIVVTDPHGRLPEFMHWLNEYVAKCVNKSLQRSEYFWAPGSYSAVALVDRGAVVAKLVYTYTNPVSAGLVRSHLEWPGAISLPDEIGGPAQRVERPPVFFRKNGPTPEHAELVMTPPPCLESLGIEPLRALLRQEVEIKERQLRDSARRSGKGFLGRRRVLAQAPHQRPRTSEPQGGIRPRIACADKWLAARAIASLKDFVAQYRQARKRWIQGVRSVLFPSGTYLMRVMFGVRCQPSYSYG